MNVVYKDASITPTGTDEDFPGTFRVVLSAPTQDRDGDTLLPDEWKQPLPSHITFDMDHGMSVASTIGSGTPYLNDAKQVPEAPDGALIVDGTYSSLPRAQEVRTLVNEGHITKTSVAFMSLPKTEKDAKPMRELLNGAFVAVPSNREALVLSSKGIKTGARNSATDMEHIQAIHDHAIALGATPATKAFIRKDADTEADGDPVALITATDAAIDEAIDLFSTVDPANLDPAIVQAIALVQAADAAVDALMDVVGIPDPDEDAEPARVAADPAAAERSPAAASVPAKAVNAESDEMQARAARMRFYGTLSNSPER